MSETAAHYGTKCIAETCDSYTGDWEVPFVMTPEGPLCQPCWQLRRGPRPEGTIWGATPRFNTTRGADNGRSRVTTVERIYDHRATCDGCARSTMVRLDDPGDGNSPYVCGECDEQHDRAMDAAFEAVQATGHAGRLSNEALRSVVTTAITTYFEYLGRDIDSERGTPDGGSSTVTPSPDG